jgi:Ricin-type beta-trefoil lectin domain/Lysozyme like domain
VTRPSFRVLGTLALPLTLALLAVAIPAQASVALAPGTGAAGARAATAVPTAPPGSVTIAPLTGAGPLTDSQATDASSTCVRYATEAGWPNNGYFSGDLVTAAAICVAESAGHPGLYVCDNSGGDEVGHGEYVSGQPVNCPAGTVSYDRGLWQLNNVNASAVTDACAFSAPCNAGQAYLFSQRGTDFEPWSSYDQDVYTQFIDPVQAQITRLTSGTVTSALLGECLAQQASKVNKKVEITNCGSGAPTQLWTISGGKLRSGSVCAAIGSGSKPGIVLRRCASGKSQDWSIYGRDELRNAADGKCLTVPGSSLAAGTQTEAMTCKNAKNQTWWLP